MIQIKKENDKLSIKGHSGYDVHGKDIVCASVSSIVITSINAMIRVDDQAILYKQEEGFIEVTITKHSDMIDLLMDNMIDLLKELENQYKKYIKII